MYVYVLCVCVPHALNTHPNNSIAFIPSLLSSSLSGGVRGAPQPAHREP